MGCGGTKSVNLRQATMKTLVLSDLHLGIGASCAANLLDGIRNLARQYDRVILNGDTLDRYEAPDCEPQAALLLKQAKEACQSRTGEPEIITGNHDPVISTQHWLYDEHSATLIFHGDCIADLTHPTKHSDQMLAARLRKQWSRLGGRPARFMDLIDVHRGIQAQYLRENPRILERSSALEYLARVFYPPQKPFHILAYWRNAPGLAGKLAATFDKPVRHAVVGHSHRAGNWMIGSVRVMNTGAFMPLSKPHAVQIDGTEVSHHLLERLLVSGRTVSMPAPSAACKSEVQA
jgi:UDP-2,3-diacylglucosamine pyrophosphatase LpxH